MIQLTIAIDIGGTNTVFGLVDKAGEILGSGSIKTADYPDFDEYILNIKQNIDELSSKIAEPHELIALGAGVPNVNYHTGVIEDAPNLPWKGRADIKGKFQVYYPGMPMYFTNDANAATLGEMVFGGAKGMKDFVFITLGTGLGSGFVANGKLIYGHDGFAGELGHITAIYGGRRCGCARDGCLETYCSATGLVRSYKEFSGSDDEISSYEIYQKAVAGDEFALKTFDFTADILGRALANTVAVSSPEAIFIFGGLANSGDMLFEPLKKYFEQNLMGLYKGKVKILPSHLQGRNAGLLGAAALCMG